jgi:hypothetical protein
VILSKRDYPPKKNKSIKDSKGKPTRVYIPIGELEKLKKHHKDLESMEYERPYQRADFTGTQRSSKRT